MQLLFKVCLYDFYVLDGPLEGGAVLGQGNLRFPVEEGDAVLCLQPFNVVTETLLCHKTSLCGFAEIEFLRCDLK